MGLVIAAVIAELICCALLFVTGSDADGNRATLWLIVPYGLSAAALLARLRWALPASAVVMTFLAATFVVSAVDRGTRNSYVGAAVLSVPGLLLLPQWLITRRRNKRARDAATEPKAEERAEEQEWIREWAGGRANYWLMLGFGALALVAGVAMSFDGDVGAALAVASFGVALLAVAPVFKTWDRRGQVSLGAVASRHGQIGVVFPYSRSKTRAAIIASIFMAVSCAGLAISAGTIGNTGEDERGLVVFGIIGASFFGIIGAVALTRGRAGPWQIVLLPDGVYAEMGKSRSFVPWDVITDVVAVEMKTYARGATAKEPFLGLMVSDPELIEMSKLSRALLRVNRLLAADMNYPIRSLDVDPRVLLETVEYYWRTPDARPELASATGLARVTNR